MERWLGWPTLQRDHVARTSRAGSSSIRSRRISSRIANEVTGRDLGWYFDQVYRSSNVFDYGVQDLKSARDGDQYRTTVVVRRYGEAIFPVDVLVTFANGERVTEHWDGKDRWKALHATIGRRRRCPRRSIPNRVLLLDVNYTNNSRTLEPQGPRGGDEMVDDVDGVAAGLPAVVGDAGMSAVGGVARRHPPRQPRAGDSDRRLGADAARQRAAGAGAARHAGAASRRAASPPTRRPAA